MTLRLRVAVGVVVVAVSGCTTSPSDLSNAASDALLVDAGAEVDTSPEPTGSDQDDADPDDPNQNDADQNDGEQIDAEEFEEFVYVSPINDVLGRTVGQRDTRQQAAIDAQALDRELAVAECMAAEGFEYIPRPAEDPGLVPVREPTVPLDRNSREFAETYGFGYSTLYFPQRRVGPGLVGYDQDKFDAQAIDAIPVDPNSSMREQMSAEEGAAYDRALFGTRSTSGEEPTDRELGCFKASYNELSGDDELYSRFLTEFDADIADLMDQVRADPRVVAARAEADECIARAGYQALEQPWQVQELFQGELGDLGVRDRNTNEPPSDNGIPTEFQGRFESQLTDDVMEGLREIQAREIMMATAYADCGRVGLQLSEEFFDVFDVVRIELEEKFVVENADRIALLLAELN